VTGSARGRFGAQFVIYRTFHRKGKFSMCNHDGCGYQLFDLGAFPTGTGFPRRRFIAGAGGLAAAALLAACRAGHSSSEGPRVSKAPRNSAGETLQTVAGHLHASFDEFDGSWAAQFAQARLHGVDILVPASHDHRVEFLGYRDGFHFSDMAEPGLGGTWNLVPHRKGTLSSGSAAEITHKPWDGDRAVRKGSLRLTAESTGAARGTLEVTVDASGANLSYHGSVVGRYPSIAVWPVGVSTEQGFLGLRVKLSYDPALRAPRQLLFRFRTDIGNVRRQVRGALGTVDVPVAVGRWTNVPLNLLTTINTLWPDTVAADNAISGLHLVATATGAGRADGYLAGLLMNYDHNADMISEYRKVIDHYRKVNSSLVVVDGLEFSLAGNYHLCQVGGRLAPYPYPAHTGSRPTLHLEAEQVTHIHRHGGVTTYNHPFGYGWPLVPEAARAALLQETKQQLVPAAIYGCQVMETGYDVRGLDLAAHLSLFDALCANGVFVTANGATDDHWGRDWSARVDRFLTYPWMGSRSEAGLKAALAGGRATVGRLGDWSGGLDLRLNDRARMGSVLVGQPARRSDQLRIELVNAPKGSSLHVLSGAVDYAGATGGPPAELASARVPAAGTGSVQLGVPGSHDRFLRVEVHNPQGEVVAFSNPVWQLSRPPAPGRPPVPAARRVAAA
jgi:hypothetical protein